MKGKFGKPPRSVNKLEKTVEQSAVDHAKEEGFMSRKMNGMGYISWPDRIFLPRIISRKLRKVPVLWVEFKRVGEDLTPSQADLHVELISRGQRVRTCRTMDEFRRELNAFYREECQK